MYSIHLLARCEKGMFVFDYIYSTCTVMVPHFPVSVCGSSCNYLFFGLILAASFYFLASPRQNGMLKNRKRKKTSENEAENVIIT